MGHYQLETLRHPQVLKPSNSDVEVVLMLIHGGAHMWRCLDLVTHVLDIQTFWARCKFSLILLSICQIFSTSLSLQQTILNSLEAIICAYRLLNLHLRLFFYPGWDLAYTWECWGIYPLPQLLMVRDCVPITLISHVWSLSLINQLNKQQRKKKKRLTKCSHTEKRYKVIQ